MPAAFPAGYISPEFLVGDTDRLTLGDELFGYEFPSATKISLRQEKIITATKINGRKGTIKEMSGFDDWQIRIEFTLLAATYSFSLPLLQSMLSKLKELRSLWIDQTSLPVINDRLNALKIKNVVLKTFELPDSGIQYNQPIILTALSDEEDYSLDKAGSDSTGDSL